MDKKNTDEIIAENNICVAEKITIDVSKEDKGCRIDKFLAENLKDYTRSYVQKLIENGCVKIMGKSVKTNYKVKDGESIEVNFPEAEKTDIVPENIPLDIVYEDSDLLVVNKCQGMVVHPAPGNYSGTLVNALMYHCGNELSGINGEIRPGILHRIDKDTSGLLLVAKTNAAHLFLAEQIKAHSLTRAYLAIVHGGFKEKEGTVNLPIGRHPSDRKKMTVTYKNSREAVTHYYVKEALGKYTYVECVLETGRTHQIRVHMSHNGHPIVGDKTYGVKKEEFNLNGQLLHAYKIGFIHPTTKKYMEFSAPLPKYFEKVLYNLESKC